MVALPKYGLILLSSRRSSYCSLATPRSLCRRGHPQGSRARGVMLLQQRCEGCEPWWARSYVEIEELIVYRSKRQTTRYNQVIEDLYRCYCKVSSTAILRYGTVGGGARACDVPNSSGPLQPKRHSQTHLLHHIKHTVNYILSIEKIWRPHCLQSSKSLQSPRS